jgi:protein SCO1
MRPGRRNIINTIALCLAVLILPDMRAGAIQNAPPIKPQSPNQEAASPSQKYFTDVALINQDGESMRLYSDLLKGKVVVINPFFASCTGVCPAMNKNLEKIQEALGDRLGKDAYIISITVDPANDTPPLLKEYSKRFNAKRGWYFLTGKKENVDLALYKLGQYVNAKEDHSNIIIIGNDLTGLWKKAFGLAKPEDLIEVVGSVLNDKGTRTK